MSPGRTAAKLTGTMRLQTQQTGLLVGFKRDSNPTAGLVLDRHGAERHVAGWLVSLHLLEHHRPTVHD